MFTTLAQPILFIGGMASVALMTNCFIYFSFRAIEQKSQTIPVVFTLFTVASLFLLNPIFSEELIKGFAPILFLLLASTSIISCSFYRNSAGKINSPTLAFLSMLLISLSGFLASSLSLPLHKVNDLIPFFASSRTAPLLLVTLIAFQSLIPPFLFWKIKSSRLRPGIDKHFDE